MAEFELERIFEDHRHTGTDSLPVRFRDIEGAPDEVILMAREGFPSTTNGCQALSTFEWVTNDIDFQALRFDKDTDEYCQFSTILPKYFTAANPNIQLYWNSSDAAKNTHSIDLEEDSSQYLDISDASQTGLDPIDNFTIEAWINLEKLASDSPAGDMAIMSKRDPNNGFRFFIESSNDKLTIECKNAGGVTTKEMDTAFVSGDKGNWIHVAVSVILDGASGTSTIEFYKNGSSEASTFINDNIDDMGSSSESFKIGASTDGFGNAEAFFDGLIDEVRFWDDIRTSGEISTNYQKEILGTEANLQGYWTLDNILTDETSNGNDLTNNNSAVFSTDVPFTGGIGTTENVVWTVEGIAYKDGDIIDTAWGTAVSITDANTDEDGAFNITDKTAFTPAGQLVAGGLLQIRVGRDADNVADVFDFDAELLGIKLSFD